MIGSKQFVRKTRCNMADRVQSSDLVGSQCQVGRAEIVVELRERPDPKNGHQARRAVRTIGAHPGNRDLGGRGAGFRSDSLYSVEHARFSFAFLPHGAAASIVPALFAAPLLARE